MGHCALLGCGRADLRRFLIFMPTIPPQRYSHLLLRFFISCVYILLHRRAAGLVSCLTFYRGTPLWWQCPFFSGTLRGSSGLGCDVFGFDYTNCLGHLLLGWPMVLHLPSGQGWLEDSWFNGMPKDGSVFMRKGSPLMSEDCLQPVGVGGCWLWS